MPEPCAGLNSKARVQPNLKTQDFDPYKYYLKIHFDAVHLGIKVVKCDKCNKGFSNKNSLKCHIKSIHQGKKTFGCKYCDKKFYSNTNARRHTQNVHFGQYSNSSFCHVCNKSVNHMKLHLKTVHSDEIFECLQCGIKYKHQVSLTRHNNEKHQNLNKNSFACDFCQKVFMQKSKLKIHIDLVHCRKNESKCMQCDKTFASEIGVRAHMKNTHNSENLTRCELCGKYFKDVNQHYNNVHETKRTFQCDSCPSTFGTKANLNCHMNRNHALKVYDCDFCGKKFNSRISLKDHLPS